MLALTMAFGSAGIGNFSSSVSAEDVSAAELAENTVSSDIFSEEARDVNVGYLLREDFSAYNAGGSGWEQVHMPGGAGIATVASNNTSVETYIKKSFVGQSGDVTTEFKAALTSDIASGYMRIFGRKGNKEVKAIQIKIENNKLVYIDGDGEKTYLGELSYSGFTGIRIEANAGKNAVTIYVDGKATAETTNLSFSEPCEKLCGLQYGIDASSVGGYRLANIIVRKGYDVYEDLASVGVDNTRSADYDYAQNCTVRATVNNHTIANDNTDLAPLAFDGDDSTYWEHNISYTITNNVYFIMNFKGEVVSVDYLRIKFAGNFKGTIDITSQSPTGSWGGFGGNSNIRFEATAENEGILELSSSSPVSLTELAIGFMKRQTDDFPNEEIKLASVEVMCKNPEEKEINGFPSDWTKVEPQSSSAATATVSGKTVMRIEDDNETESVEVNKTFRRDGDVTLDFKVSFKDVADGNRVGLENGNGDFVGITTKDGVLQIVQLINDRETLVPIVNEKAALDKFRAGIWLTFGLKYSETDNVLAVDYNGWSPVAPVKLDDAFKNAAWTAFKAVSAVGCTEFMLDDIHVYPTQKQSDVPDVEYCDTGDTIVTMQVCSLWREGSHLGWGVLDYEDCYNRQPILGWYDEGSAEVADWEIKIAAEHGVTNMMYCWYRSGTGEIVSSNFGDAIWNGMFKSKFRDDINFSIMFENSSGLYGYNDLIENIMPYWIEVFFKNPNYQKTADGKPMLYIYNGDLLNTVGDINGDGKRDKNDMKIVTDKMREMCVEAGLPGLYIATEVRSKSTSVIRSMENYGYDSVFAYCWTSGQYNISDDETLAFSQDMLLGQRAAVQNKDSFAVIPNISKSWDRRAWKDCGFSGSDAAYMYDLEHYRQFMLWVKDVYGGAVIDESGTKMVMLDNWNEYSEGHWLMPTYGTPSYKDGRYAYGYLDIIREVFGIGDYAHTDYLPLEDGFGPYDTWYPTGWEESVNIYGSVFGNAVDTSVKDTEIVDWGIGYNTLGGVTAYVGTLTTENGMADLNLENANRVVFERAAVKALKEANASLRIEMLYGTVELSADEVSALDESKSLEIVLNAENDVTAAAIAVRKANGGYTLCDGSVYAYSLKQSGRALSVSATVTLAEVPEIATGYCLLGETLEKSDAVLSGALSLTLSSECSIILVS